MEQIQELLEILKQTPEMALWALSIYFIFILLKLASWVFALKVVAQQLIKRLFDYKEKALANKRGHEISEYFKDNKISSVSHASLYKLLDAIRDNGIGNYIHESHIGDAIRKIKHDK